jgi:peptidoglycan-N-acetylglucosamine deacetylase
MQKQVFQTSDTTRWTRFRWTMRIVIFAAAILLASVLIMLFIEKTPSVPFNEDYKSIVTASKPLLQETKLSKEYKGFRDVITDKKMHTNYEKEKKERLEKYKNFGYNTINDSTKRTLSDKWSIFSAGIRSAFYVDWDRQSLFSLQRNINNLNLVIPEWFFIDPTADTVRTSVNKEAYQLMKSSGVPIMPILSNNFNREFRSEPLSRILHSKEKRALVINSALNECIKNKFIGINIDFEEVNEKSDEYLIQFVKEMADIFHKNGLWVTQDIMPFNTDYNLTELSKYNDYLILMAYDEYSQDGDPGPICSQRWIEAAVDDFAKKVPAGKIILGLGAFGYDWPVREGVDPAVTYQQALSRASASKALIDFNNDTYNLNYSYTDDSSLTHQVFFTDAGTQFNTMRFGAEYGLAGFAVWRLGSEDSRLWKFYGNRYEKACHQ